MSSCGGYDIQNESTCADGVSTWVGRTAVWGEPGADPKTVPRLSCETTCLLRETDNVGESKKIIIPRPAVELLFFFCAEIASS